MSRPLNHHLTEGSHPMNVTNRAEIPPDKPRLAFLARLGVTRSQLAGLIALGIDSEVDVVQIGRDALVPVLGDDLADKVMRDAIRRLGVQ